MVVNWINGAPAYAVGSDRFGNLDPGMVGTNVGYFGDLGRHNPVVNEVYAAHVVVAVGYPLGVE